MSAIFGRLTKVTTVVSNLVKNGGYINRGFKSDLKIKWVRPEKLECFDPRKTGDGGLDHKVTEKDLALRFQDSEELISAPDVVKKLFSLEFMHISETEAMNREKTRSLVKRHEADRGSMESRIATMTSEILYLQKHMQAHPRNKRTKAFLKELIDKRKKFLSKLRKCDYKRFEWILQKLNLIYKPNLLEYCRITRKSSMRQLTKKHCDGLVQAKLDSYKNELLAQQKDFFAEKAASLAFIRAEEIACGVEPTVSEEEIEEARVKAAEFR